METVTVSRVIDREPETVRSAMNDVGPFMQAAGFDEIDVDGETIHVANQVGPATIELTLVLTDDSDSALAYEQQTGIFEEMHTSYTVASAANGTDVTATTEFALDVALVGGVLDATVIKRQRRAELEAQFDWLETIGKE